jgi:hypothetical protein
MCIISQSFTCLNFNLSSRYLSKKGDANFIILCDFRWSGVYFFGWIRRVEYHNNSNGRSGAAGIDVYTGGDIEEKEA